MADKTIKTRLVLRNADLSAWEKSELSLLQGEVALARLSGDMAGKYKMRIGTGDKTWNQLSDQGQLIIPAENVEGLVEKIASLSTSYYECSAIADLGKTGYVNGDIAVEKRDIGDTGKQEYCAYRYSTQVSDWQALDGNYSADNVYFKDNMTITYAFGKYTIPSTGSKELTCAGMNVREFINDAFAETKNPTVKYPYGSFSASNSSGEVGTTYTVPGATFKVEGVGSYSYDASTGITVPIASASISCTTTGSTQSNATALGKGNTFSLPAGASTAYIDAGATYSYRAEATYCDGIIPHNNVGNEVSALQIKSDLMTANDGHTGNKYFTTSATCSGWRRCFWGYRTVAEGALTAFGSADIRDNIHATSLRNQGDAASGYTKTSSGASAMITKFKVLAGTKQLIFAVPKTFQTGSVVCTMINTSIGQLQLDNDNKRQQGKCSVEGANGSAAVDYDIWTYTAEGSFAADTEYSITWSAS